MSPGSVLSPPAAPSGKREQDGGAPISRAARYPLPGGGGPREHDPAGLFVSGFAACVLMAGWLGVLLPGREPSQVSGQDEEPDVEVMVEALPSSPEQEHVPTAPEAALLPAGDPPLMPDIPEPVPALTEEAVFSVPDAPDLVTPLVLSQVKSERPRPAARPSPPAPAPAGAKPSAATAPRTVPDGPGEGAGKEKKAKTPQPPYPSFARSRRMSGTVLVSIQVDSSGAVISATATRSCGFPELDNYTTEFIGRRWRWPEGGRRTFLQPVSYRLR